MKQLHIGITSVLFDRKPEGICTGRLVRALLQRGHRITLATSTKAESGFNHPNLRVFSAAHGPRYPRWFFKALARARGGIYSNFYLWSRAISEVDFAGDIPDVFYGRAWPHASLVPAYLLAKRYERPLLFHFSDPFPRPSDDIEPRLMAELQKMVDEADALTFTNKQTIAYQQRYLRFDPQQAFILPHVAPEAFDFGEPGIPGHFYHAGAFSPDRPVAPLLDGFSLHVASHPNSRLFLVGAPSRYVTPEIASRGLQNTVQVLPFTRDIREVFRRAGVLVSVDAFLEEPIFTPTKIIDYLVSDRPVLALTPPKSPVYELVSRHPDSTIAVTDYSPASVAAGLDAALKLEWNRGSFENRWKAMDTFRPGNVVRQFEQIVAHIDKQD